MSDGLDTGYFITRFVDIGVKAELNRLVTRFTRQEQVERQKAKSMQLPQEKIPYA